MIAQWKTRDEPQRIAFRERMSRPPVGIHKRKQRAGCYGVCCGEGTRGGRVCTVCHKYTSHEFHCCGYHTVEVNPRIRVPAAQAKGRWALFVRRFPRFRNREELRCEGQWFKGEEVKPCCLVAITDLTVLYNPND